ncbi:PHP domain-containing protein [uncultured Propionibacterium sp.]|uniref:PHP domain-containing protein n=1 Tax=uncultured Propionibacterium sp. TaxID=218066 RepID=UPI00292F704F|nr:PHP domain-containing protein [uncultured Propionibacterium sp.]
MRIDLHTHSNVSDGTDSPTVLVRKAQRNGVAVVALCDHDCFDGLPEAEEAGRRFGVAVLPGIEISTHSGDAQIHLLGYGCDPWAEPLRGELSRMRASRATRVGDTLGKLEALGMHLTESDVLEQAGAATTIGRPHIADALVVKGYVADRDEAFAAYLYNGGPAYVERETLDLGRAIDLVHQARGVAVMAHPWIRGNSEAVAPELIARMVREHGLDGIEVDHPDQDQETRRMLFDLGGRLGLVRTGSSDYHGRGKTGHEIGCETTRPSALHEVTERIAARGGDLGTVEQILNRL